MACLWRTPEAPKPKKGTSTEEEENTMREREKERGKEIKREREIKGEREEGERESCLVVAFVG